MSNIICPHCDHEYNDADMEKSSSDLWGICSHEEIVEEKCTNCGKIFWIQGSYIPKYYVYKTENEIL